MNILLRNGHGGMPRQAHDCEGIRARLTAVCRKCAEANGARNRPEASAFANPLMLLSRQSRLKRLPVLTMKHPAFALILFLNVKISNAFGVRGTESPAWKSKRCSRFTSKVPNL